MASWKRNGSCNDTRSSLNKLWNRSNPSWGNLQNNRGSNPPQAVPSATVVEHALDGEIKPCSKGCVGAQNCRPHPKRTGRILTSMLFCGRISRHHTVHSQCRKWFHCQCLDSPSTRQNDLCPPRQTPGRCQVYAALSGDHSEQMLPRVLPALPIKRNCNEPDGSPLQQASSSLPQ